MPQKLIFIGPTNSGKTTTSENFNFPDSEIFNFDLYYKEIRKADLSFSFLKAIKTTNRMAIERIRRSDQKIVIYEGAHLILPHLFDEIIKDLDKTYTTIVIYNFSFDHLIKRMKSRISFRKNRSEKIFLLLLSFLIFKIFFPRTIKILNQKNFTFLEIKNSKLKINETVQLIKTQFRI